MSNIGLGYGHAGIINTLNYAKELTREDRICSVLGGMHLSGGLFEPIIPTTMEELEKLKPKFVVPCHCSGLKAMTEIARRMPASFIQNSVGTSYIFWISGSSPNLGCIYKFQIKVTSQSQIWGLRSLLVTYTEQKLFSWYVCNVNRIWIRPHLFI